MTSRIHTIRLRTKEKSECRGSFTGSSGAGEHEIFVVHTALRSTSNFRYLGNALRKAAATTILVPDPTRTGSEKTLTFIKSHALPR